MFRVMLIQPGTDGTKTDILVDYAYVWNDRCVDKRVQTFASNNATELLAAARAPHNFTVNFIQSRFYSFAYSTKLTQ